jgi:hypothetical protein
MATNTEKTVESGASDPDRILWGAEAIANEVNRTTPQAFRMLEQGHLRAKKAGKIWVSTPRILRDGLTLDNELPPTLFDTVMRDAAILLSFALQYGADFEMIRRALVRNGDGTASGPIGALLDLVKSMPADHD